MSNSNTPINGSRAYEICDGDIALYASLVVLFTESREEMLSDIESAIAERNAVKVEDTVHKIKGALRNLATTGVVEHLQEAENMARKGDLEGSIASYSKAKPELEFLFDYLDQEKWRETFTQ